MKDKAIIFLDVDGVLNCQLFYDEYFKETTWEKNIPLYKQVKKMLKRLVKQKKITDVEYYRSQICSKRISWLNDLCVETNAVVVVSASMRGGKTPEQLQEIYNRSGATFQVIDKTGHCECRIRGVEIFNWLHDNIKPEVHGVHYFDFHRYAIIDDDADMLLEQGPHFFQTDSYSGLTPMLCEKIRRFLTKKTFRHE